VQVKERFTIRILGDSDDSVAYAGPLVLLVDRRSASASEIVAAALQDYGRAVIVGDTKTHGKGTVQNVLAVGRDPQLGSLKVTTASYYRISGDSTQLRGVRPDIVVPSPFDVMEIGEEFLPNAVQFSPVPPAAYRPLTDLSSALAKLQDRSQERREQDPRFAAYRQLLARIEQLSQTRTISLRLDERRRFAEMERELADLEAQLDAEEPDPNARNGKPDLVLRETLLILSDLIAECAQRPALRPDFREEPATLAERFNELLRGRGLFDIP
jgi:carboxyl-terminal processing protease